MQHPPAGAAVEQAEGGGLAGWVQLTVVAGHPQKRRNQLRGLLAGNGLLALRLGLRLLGHGCWVLRRRGGWGNVGAGEQSEGTAAQVNPFCVQLPGAAAQAGERGWRGRAHSSA